MQIIAPGTTTLDPKPETKVDLRKTPFCARRDQQKKLAKDGLRRCPRCERILPLTSDNFRFNAKGLADYCRVCLRGYMQKYCEAHKYSSKPDVNLMTRLYHAFQRAKKTGLEFSLIMADIAYLWQRQEGRCYYTGVSLTLTKRQENTVSLDRVDSSGGYIKSNVVLCCSVINLMKRDLSVERFRDWCKKVVTCK